MVVRFIKNFILSKKRLDSFEIEEIINDDAKSKICNDILKSLPKWFGDYVSIADYVKQVRSMPFYAAYVNNGPVGFVAIKPHNPFTAEICVMSVSEKYHRQGVGTMLVSCCEEYCKKNKMEFLTVKTLDESKKDENYEKTRLFYLSVGFRPVEVIPLFWNEENPCLFMAKYIAHDARPCYNIFRKG